MISQNACTMGFLKAVALATIGYTYYRPIPCPQLLDKQIVFIEKGYTEGTVLMKAVCKNEINNFCKGALEE